MAPMTAQDFAVVHVASSVPEAQILAGLLVSEGVPARVPGTELSDEFGMAMRLGAGEVIVPTKHLEKAQEIVRAWRERGEEESNSSGDS